MSEQTEHVVGLRVYFLVYLALVAGVGLQVLLANLNLGIFNPILMLAIAISQATLVALFSMHLKYGPKISMLGVGSAIFMLFTLFGMVLLDYVSRAWGSW